MEVRWLRKALHNLDREAAYIAREDPAAARRVVGRIRRAVDLLAENPALGSPGRIPDTRELVVPDTHYIIPYRVRPRLNRVEILRVFHAANRRSARAREIPAVWRNCASISRAIK